MILICVGGAYCIAQDQPTAAETKLASQVRPILFALLDSGYSGIARDLKR
jgi:hypothetical protein